MFEAAAGRQWFYMSANQRLGPVPESLLRALIRDEQLDSGVPVWTDGMDDWESALTTLPRYAFREYAASPVRNPAPPIIEQEVTTLPDGEPVFFPVSTTKFVVMSIVTLGMYELYWAYRTWSFVRRRDSVKMMPFWRAWFMIFWVFDLLKLIKRDLSHHIPVTYRPGWLTLAYVVLALSWRLPGIGLVSFLGFLPLVPAVAAIHTANDGRIPPDKLNTRFTGWNIAGIVVFVLLVMSAFVPESWLPS